MPTKRWFSQQLWKRVPSPVRHDPKAFRIYAADEDILDVISGAAYTAAHDTWWNEHINDVDAEAAIKAALAAIRVGEGQLDQAVVRARRKGCRGPKSVVPQRCRPRQPMSAGQSGTTLRYEHIEPKLAVDEGPRAPG